MVVTASFDSYAGAEETGYVERKWIPDYIPATAGKIEEAHNLDTNQSCGKVEKQSAEIDLLKEKQPAEAVYFTGRQSSRFEDAGQLPLFMERIRPR